MTQKSYLLSTLLLLFNLITYGQDTTIKAKKIIPLKWELAATGGYYWPHRPELAHLASHTNGIQIAGFWPVTETRMAGASIQYQNLGPLSGYAIAAMLHASLPVSRYIHWRIGGGLNYASNTFNLQNNFNYTPMGDAFSIALQTGLFYSVHLSPTWAITSGLQFTHFSNASFAQPNLGINIPQLYLATSLSSGKPRSANEWAAKDSSTSKSHILTNASVSIVEALPNASPKYLVGQLGIGWQKKRRYLHPLIQLDAFYNGSYTSQSSYFEPDKESPNNFRLGIYGGAEYDLLPRFSMTWGVGFYLYKPQPIDPFTYQRLGAVFKINDQIAITTTLKTHFGKAECAELGMRYRF